MIEANARIVAIEPGALWVEGRSSLRCARCSAGQGCGMGLMSMVSGAGRHYLRIRLDGREEARYRIGQTVSVGVPERALADGAALVYLLPILGLLAGALGVGADAHGAALALAGAVGGLAAGGALAWGAGRWLGHRRAWRPVLLD